MRRLPCDGPPLRVALPLPFSPPKPEASRPPSCRMANAAFAQNHVMTPRCSQLANRRGQNIHGTRVASSAARVARAGAAPNLGDPQNALRPFLQTFLAFLILSGVP
jgi:hypothetical protein